MTLTQKWISLKGGSMQKWECGAVMYWMPSEDPGSLSFGPQLSCLLGGKRYQLCCSDWECASVLAPAAILILISYLYTSILYIYIFVYFFTFWG